MGIPPHPARAWPSSIPPLEPRRVTLASQRLLAQPFTIESSSDPIRTVQPRNGRASAAGACALCCRCLFVFVFLLRATPRCHPERSARTRATRRIWCQQILRACGA